MEGSAQTGPDEVPSRRKTGSNDIAAHDASKSGVPAELQKGIPTDLPAESDRVLSIALESHCVMVEIEGHKGLPDLAALLERPGAPSSWLWVESYPKPPGSVVRGVCTEPGPDEKEIAGTVPGSAVTVRVRRGLATASLVGEAILARPALLREALECLAEAGIEVVAARSGSLSLSLLVEERWATQAVRLLHDRFVT